MTPSHFARLGIALLAVGCASAPSDGERAPTPPASHAQSDDRRVLVTLRAGSEVMWRDTARELWALYEVRLVASWFMPSLAEQCLVLEGPGSVAPEEVARRVARFPSVSSASPVRRFRVLASSPQDPYVHLQQYASQLRSEDAHRAATGRGVTVAVVDTGLELDHPDLAGRVVRASDFANHGGGFTSDVHGTAVAGVIAANGGNGFGIVGVAPEASLWALKACWQEAQDSPAAVCDSYTVAQALDAAIVGGVRVMNLSLAGAPDVLIARLVEEALRRGIVVVAAAEGAPPAFPASLDGVLAVHAWNGSAPIRPSEPSVPTSALVAPGIDILTTVPHGAFDFLSGSSFSAAQASGVAALVLEVNPKLGPQEIKEMLIATAESAPDGSHVLDACSAVAAARGTQGCGADR